MKPEKKSRRQVHVKQFKGVTRGTNIEVPTVYVTAVPRGDRRWEELRYAVGERR